jgi:hypothetical protein
VEISVNVGGRRSQKYTVVAVVITRIQITHLSFTVSQSKAFSASTFNEGNYEAANSKPLPQSGQTMS